MVKNATKPYICNMNMFVLLATKMILKKLPSTANILFRQELYCISNKVTLSFIYPLKDATELIFAQ